MLPLNRAEDSLPDGASGRRHRGEFRVAVAGVSHRGSSERARG